AGSAASRRRPQQNLTGCTPSVVRLGGFLPGWWVNDLRAEGLDRGHERFCVLTELPGNQVIQLVPPAPPGLLPPNMQEHLMEPLKVLWGYHSDTNPNLTDFAAASARPQRRALCGREACTLAAPWLPTSLPARRLSALSRADQ